jgi:hypothetical protein
MSTPSTRVGIVRAGTVAALAAATLLAGPATSASADDTYVPDQPSMRLTTLVSACEADVAYLDYAIEVEGTDHDTVTVTWINPDGDDVVETGLPLSGRLRWPGAVADEGGQGVDWPGWRYEGGEWVEGDEYDWVRPQVDVRFEVNPNVLVTTVYPPSTPDCSTNPPGHDDPVAAAPVSGSGASASAPSRSLASTGATVGLYAAAAAALAGVGAAVVLLSRRARRG